jgi:death-on-curing protein
VSAWTWLDVGDALAIHERVLMVHGGPPGVRDLGALSSAMARAQQRSRYGEDVDIADLAGAYTCGIVRDHPFVDGNKRTGFVLGILFLELNGGLFHADEAAAAQAVLNLAAGNLSEGAYAQFLRESMTVA